MPLLDTRLNLACWRTMVPPLVAMACIVGLTRGLHHRGVGHRRVPGRDRRCRARTHDDLVEAVVDRRHLVFATTTLTFLIASAILAPFAAANGFLAHADPAWTPIACLAVLADLAYPMFFTGDSQVSLDP